MDFGLEFWPFRPYESPENEFLAMPRGYVSNKNCCKGSSSKKSLKNTAVVVSISYLFCNGVWFSI